MNAREGRREVAHFVFIQPLGEKDSEMGWDWSGGEPNMRRKVKAVSLRRKSDCDKRESVYARKGEGRRRKMEPNRPSIAE